MMHLDSSPRSIEHSVRAVSLGQCWFECIRLILREGTVVFDEDVEILEVLGLAVHIEEPAIHDELIARHGDPLIIERTLHKFERGVRMPDRPFTYGERIYEHNSVDQFEWLVRRLSAKKETKSATICLLTPGENGNLPCLTTLDAKIRNDTLQLHFFYRSQNVFGRQYANLLALASFQADLAARCSVGIGPIKGFISSAHIYSFDADDANRLIHKSDIQIKDNYYVKGPLSVRIADNTLDQSEISSARS
jgi:hypothetical protein